MTSLHGFIGKLSYVFLSILSIVFIFWAHVVQKGREGRLIKTAANITGGKIHGIKTEWVEENPKDTFYWAKMLCGLKINRSSKWWAIGRNSKITCARCLSKTINGVK